MTALLPALEQYLPDSKLPILTLLSFKLPAAAPAAPGFVRQEKFVSELPPNSENVDEIAALRTPPSNVVSALEDLVKDPSIRSIQCPHEPHAGGKRFPVATVLYWAHIIAVRDVQTRWKHAVDRLRTRMDEDVESTLLRTAFRGHCPTSLAFFTTEWLSDNHELLMLDMLKEDLEREGQEIFVENTAFALLLTAARCDRQNYPLMKHYQWLREKGDAIAKCEKPYLASIINVNQVHWVAVIIDSRKRQVLYGDPLGHPIVNDLKQVLDWWIQYHTQGTRFSYHPLPVSGQSDSYSCGVLSWDGLRSFLLKSKPLLIDPMSTHNERIKIFLRLVTAFDKEEGGPHSFKEDEQETSSQVIPKKSMILDAVDNMVFDTPPEASMAYSEGSEDESNYATTIKSDSSSSTDTESFDDASDNDDDSDDPFFDSTVSTLQNYTLAPPPVSSTRNLKRTYQESTNTPTSSPTRKRARPQAMSSIRKAFDQKGKPRGLLQYFNKATEDDHQAFLARSTAELDERADNEKRKKERDEKLLQIKKRQGARERKQKQRAREKKSQISRGLRSPGGTKIQVKRAKEVHLAYPPKIDLGGSVAELSRPANALNRKFMEKQRKPQGRKLKHQHKETKYFNWLTTFLFTQIETARITAGGPNWSTRGIAKELTKRDPETFQHLNRTTIDKWIDRTGDKPKWSEKTLERVKHGNQPGHTKGGRKGILAGHPEVVTLVKEQLEGLCENGAQVSIVTVRGIMIASVISKAPELLQKTFSDGSTFCASDSFVRKWLHEEMNWSRRKGTQAAQKLPDNWEDLCEKSFLRDVYVIKEEDIPAILFVSSDQTNSIFAPGDKMTWTTTGSKQVQVLGGEEKRAFTVLVSVASDGTVLPMQAIYSGKTPRSCPSPNSPHYRDLIKEGFLLEESGTKTYWSNQKTMRTFVDNILVPHFNKGKTKLGLPSSQKSLWKIDVWTVHRSKEFRDWLREKHPTIILDFVPGGCTGVFQACDVGIQRPFKLSLKRSYHEDVVSDILEQYENKETVVKLDTRIAALRDRSVKWLWKAYKAISNESLVKKAFEKCEVRQWNLSYDSLTSVAARARLREIKETDPIFWRELTCHDNDDVPAENEPQPEDIVDSEEARAEDDSDVPMRVLVQELTEKKVRKGFTVTDTGGLVADREAERFDDETKPVDHSDKELLGRGKRQRKPTQLYNNFWRHDDNDED